MCSSDGVEIKQTEKLIETNERCAVQGTWFTISILQRGVKSSSIRKNICWQWNKCSLSKGVQIIQE